MLANNEQEQGPVECRICHSRTTRDLILSPCLCKGSLASVHSRCLERWLNLSSRDSCELCSYKFNVVLNRRYSCLQSVRVWMRSPTIRVFILCDIVIGIILTSFTLLLLLLCLFGDIDGESYNQGVIRLWIKGMVNVCLLVFLAGYLAMIYFMARDCIRPWYMWWSRCNNVRLVVDKNINICPLMQESNEVLTVNKNNKSVENKPDECQEENNLTDQIKKEVDLCS